MFCPNCGATLPREGDEGQQQSQPGDTRSTGRFSAQDLKEYIEQHGTAQQPADPPPPAAMAGGTSAGSARPGVQTKRRRGSGWVLPLGVLAVAAAAIVFLLSPLSPFHSGTNTVVPPSLKPATGRSTVPPSANRTATRITATPQTAGDPQAGSIVFAQQSCGQCHGLNGPRFPGHGPDLARNSKMNPTDLPRILRQGTHRKKHYHLTAKQIRDLSAFARLFGPGPQPPTPGVSGGPGVVPPGHPQPASTLPGPLPPQATPTAPALEPGTKP